MCKTNLQKKPCTWVCKKLLFLCVTFETREWNRHDVHLRQGTDSIRDRFFVIAGYEYAQARWEVSKTSMVWGIGNDRGKATANSDRDFTEQWMTGPLISVPTTTWCDREGSCNLFRLMCAKHSPRAICKLPGSFALHKVWAPWWILWL